MKRSAMKGPFGRLTRGRPAYDDILTPREWQVLGLLQQGMTNEQIALSMGISHSGAKYHVSEIITKLGVRNREEAVEFMRQRREHAGRRAGFAAFLPALFGRQSRAAAAVIVLAVALSLGAAAVLLISGLPFTHSGSSAPGVPSPSDSELAQAAADFTGQPGDARAISFDNPFDYCSAVGTIDKADGRYTGPQNTRAMITGFARAAAVPPASPLWSGANPGPALAWRCANGELLVCSYGANIPCDSKADTSSQPTQGMIDWCANPPPNLPADAPKTIPVIVTGHDSAYLSAWECIGGKPVITGQPATVDAQGYVARYWYQVLP